MAGAMFHYLINEFHVESEFPFPGEEWDGVTGASVPRNRLIVRRANLSQVARLQRRFRPRYCYDVGDGIFFEPPCGGIHVDYRGAIIRVDAPDATLREACAWIIHIGLSAASLLHGRLPLHAGGIALRNGRAVALIAESGVGKSTLTYQCVAEGGAQFLADDIVVVDPAGEAGQPLLTFPSVSLAPKLSAAAADWFQIPDADRDPAGDGVDEDQYWVALESGHRATTPQPLGAILALHPHQDTAEEHHDTITWERVQPDEAARFYRGHLHGVWLFGQFLRNVSLDAWCEQLAQTVPLCLLRYPHGLERVAEVARLLTGEVLPVIVSGTHSGCVGLKGTEVSVG